MFVKTRTGHINTAFIKRIVKRTRTGRNGTRSEIVVSDADGDQYELASYDLQEMIKRLSCTIVPATTPMTLIAIWVGSGDKEPTIQRFPIIAWRVTPGGYADPVAVGCDVDFSDTEESRYVIELPSGKLQRIGYMGDLFDSIEACLDAMTDRPPSP